VIPEIIERFDANRENLLASFKAAHPDSYAAIVKSVVEHVTSEGEYDDNNLDPERIERIDHGDYQGTLLFVIGAKGYQPSKYWYTKVSYGSCSGCDTFEAIRDYSSEQPTEDQAKEYFNLALHIVQGLKAMQ